MSVWTRTNVRRAGGGLLAAVGVLCVVAISGAERDPAVIQAVKSGTGALQTLLRKPVDVNVAEPDGTTALHWAVRRDNAEAVRLLLAAGARVNVTNRYGVTPLLAAAEMARAPVSEALLKAGADPNQALPEGETPLMMAARAGRVDVIKLLTARGADVNARESWFGQTALMWAAAENHAEAARTLVELGADIKARSKGGFTPFLLAVREGRIAAATTLVKLGASVNDTLQPNADALKRSSKAPESTSNIVAQPTNRPFSAPAEAMGTSALVLAVASAHYELAQELLKLGADANASAQGWTALHQLQYTRRHQRSRGLPPPEQTGNLDSLGMAKALLEHGGNPNARQTREINDGQRNALKRIGATPYLLAAKLADPPMMQLLAQNGADVRMATAGGATPLGVAAGVGLFAVSDDIGTNEEAFQAVKLAYELGDRDVNAADDRGWTALHGAALRASNEIVQFLADRGAALDRPTKAEGWTPLRVADGVFHNGTFKRSEETAVLLRQLLKTRGLPVPPVPDYKKELEDAEKK